MSKPIFEKRKIKKARHRPGELRYSLMKETTERFLNSPYHIHEDLKNEIKLKNREDSRLGLRLFSWTLRI
ncbi:hypothetical protein QY97_02484 [Bacillus thermotolerans]|nr:hypothetical protein QY97_02484 [Bacillus thermotolerans]